MDQTMADDVRSRVRYEAARSGPPEVWPALPDLPLARYTSDDFFKLEIDRLFKSQWLFAGHTSEFAEPGSYRLLNLPFAPVLVVRGKDGELRGLLNACRHRGAPVVRCPEGKTKYLVCQFHSWAYGLDGKLVQVPERRDFVESVLEDRALASVRCETWGGFVFVNMDPDAPALSEWIKPLADRFSDFANAPLRVVRRQNIEIKANWKVVVEAFLESYHVKTIHPKTVAPLLETGEGVMFLMDHGHSSMFMPYHPPEEHGEDFNWLVPLPTMDGIHEVFAEGAMSNLVFPNVILPLESSGFPVMIFWPVAKDRTLYEEVWLGVDWGEGERPEGWNARLAGWDVTVEEDKLNIEPIQQAIEAAAHTGIPLSWQERRIWQFHHEIDLAMGEENVPEAIRIPGLLDHLIEPPVQQPVTTP